MKILYFIILFLILNFSIYAQSNQYIYFDGQNDYVSVENGAQYINGLNTISMTGWFYVDRFQYGAGMMGIRGDGDGTGQIYLLQLGNGKLECRINTTSGLFQVVGPDSTVIEEQWQHYAFVYDGSTFKVYIDGSLLGSTNANGIFESNTKPFGIGKSLITGYNFIYPGRADEVTLWSKALTQSDITYMINNEPVGNESGLELYFKCNQGYPFGDNTSINYLKNEIGNGTRDGLINNMAMQGSTSNFGGTLEPYIQAISFPQLPNKEVNDAPFTLNAISTSGLPVIFSIVSGPATISGNTLTLNGTAGTVVVEANQVGNTSFFAAEPVQSSFEVIDASSVFASVDIRNPLSGYVYARTLSPIELAAVIDITYPDLLNVADVKFEINGENIGVKYWNNLHYTGWWTPPAYGTYTFDVIAKNNYGASYTESVTFEVVSPTSDINLDAFTNILINAGVEPQEAEAILPCYVGAFNSISGLLDVACTPQGCDEWDFIANVEAQGHNGEWFQIIRYITPYGVPCNHNIDLTDFMSLLQGKVKFRVNYSTQGLGFQYSLNLDYQEGTPDFTYSKIDKLWNETYNFGDFADLQPCETINFDYEANTLASKIKLVSTGHGWDVNYNTGNAAEFHEDTHHIWVNGNETFTQHNWYDCNPNPDNCSPQYGTWYYDRAGWCPGTIAQWFDYDMTTFINSSPVQLNYIFDEDYVDLCHPNHPDCITGVTCNNCDQGFNPHLIVSSYIISKSNTPFNTDTTYTNISDKVDNPISFNIYPNPNFGKFYVEINNDVKNYAVTVYNTMGQIILKTENLTTNKSYIDISGISKGVYIVQVNTEINSLTHKIIVEN